MSNKIASPPKYEPGDYVLVKSSGLLNKMRITQRATDHLGRKGFLGEVIQGKDVGQTIWLEDRSIIMVLPRPKKQR